MTQEKRVIMEDKDLNINLDLIKVQKCTFNSL